MALFEFYCDKCKAGFEQLIRASDPDAGKCPKCQSKEKTRKLISRFAVGGQGDLRESTDFHGCHSSYTGAHDDHAHGGGDHAGHDHAGHDHSHED
jgi:putative FmdB family regulatory protein